MLRPRYAAFQLAPRRHISSAPDIRNGYGPFPSDLRPYPISRVITERPPRRQKRVWSEESRSKLKDAYLAQKSKGEVHRLQKWRDSNPDARDVLSESAAGYQRKANEAKLLKLLTGCLSRTLNVWAPSTCHTPRYRLTLFGHNFHLQPSTLGMLWGEPRSVFISLSISFDAPHRHPAQRTLKGHVPRFDSIGVRVFGRNPHTNKLFDEWVTTTKPVLARIFHIADRVEDQAALRTVCSTGLKDNLAGERWNC